jgi:hypothetical protein
LIQIFLQFCWKSAICYTCTCTVTMCVWWRKSAVCDTFYLCNVRVLSQKKFCVLWPYQISWPRHYCIFFAKYTPLLRPKSSIVYSAENFCVCAKYIYCEIFSLCSFPRVRLSSAFAKNVTLLLSFLCRSTLTLIALFDLQSSL